MLKVDYSCNLRDKNGRAKYWADSYIKNKIVTYNEAEMTLHEAVKKELEASDCVTCAKRFKPETEIFVDCEATGEAKHVGWIYKVKHNIQKEDRGGWVEIPFDAWVEIKKVEEFAF